MIKKTLYFGNPCYLKKSQNQLVMEYKNPEFDKRTVPIEDIGIVVLDNSQIPVDAVTCLDMNSMMLSKLPRLPFPSKGSLWGALVVPRK